MPTADMVNGLSIQTKSSFAGISIEMSVTNQICEYCPPRVLDVRLFAVRGLVRRSMAPACSLTLIITASTMHGVDRLSILGIIPLGA